MRGAGRLFALQLIAAVLLSACQARNPWFTTGSAKVELLRIDNTFDQTYTSLGGADILGPVLTNLILEQSGYSIQYTTNAVLQYQPQAITRYKRGLMALGLELGIGMPSELVGRFVAAPFEVDPIFKDFYAQYNQGLYGNPITGLRYNARLERYEQYFENVALYRMRHDPQDQVHLLALGAWKCGPSCGADVNPQALVMINPKATQVFQPSQLGWSLTLTGFPVAEAYPVGDGLYEQVYENVVLIGDPSRPSSVHMQPVPVMVGITEGSMSPELMQAGFEFVEVQDGLGFQVPDYFISFLRHNGGLEAAGRPITRPAPALDYTIRQCFEHLCLVVLDGKVFVESLGYFYQSMRTPERRLPATPAQPAGRVQVETWPAYAMINSAQEQVIWVRVLLDGRPFEGQTAELRLVRPGTDAVRRYAFPATDFAGQAMLVLGKIRGDNATLVPYTVCAQVLELSEACAANDYVIWNP